MTAVLRVARLVPTVGIAAAAGVVIVLALLGWRPIVLVSGSMAPGAPAGAVVVGAPVAGEDVRVGDVVTVQWPSAAAPVTHRVVGLAIEDGELLATTRGDANAEDDPVRARLDGAEVLRARFVVPGGGSLLASGGQRMAVGVAAIVAGLMGIAWVWAPAVART